MDKFRKVNTYIDENRIPREKLPVFHVTPPCGWMNDPNGFSAYQGKVHLFYQFHPYSEVWGPMPWGHYEQKILSNGQNYRLHLLLTKLTMKQDVFPAQESRQRKVIFWFTQV